MVDSVHAHEVLKVLCADVAGREVALCEVLDPVVEEDLQPDCQTAALLGAAVCFAARRLSAHTARVKHPPTSAPPHEAIMISVIGASLST